MERLENREKGFSAFVNAMKKDRTKSNIYSLSELGIVQMTRKRVRESLGHILREQCPYCEGNGFIKSTKTVVYEIFRRLKKINPPHNSVIEIKSNSAVADLLSDDERTGIEEIENTCGIKVIVKKDIARHQESYEISIL
ncbi:ribonuclease E/G [Thermodesulfovibrionales bacterium]|nr:ribonuclease E/G [Thermodesulfovibrionales bacterium]